MKLIKLILLLAVLASTASAQLVVDKEQIDIELHPGEVETRTLTFINIGNEPLYDITITPIGGSAKEILYLPENKIDEVDTANGEPDSNKEELLIICMVPPEMKPGEYSGFIYVYDGGLPNIPLAVQIDVLVKEQESYDVSMFIDDARYATTYAKADEPAVFDLVVKNLGRFRDVISIDAQGTPASWTVSLVDELDEYFLPYEVTLAPGASHKFKLVAETSEPGEKGEFSMTATSLGNQSKNSSIKAEADFGMEVRGYNVKIDVPERMTTNRTYQGRFNIYLDVEETVMVALIAPSELMTIPLTQIVDVTPETPGTFNFTMLASQPGTYPLIFSLRDSNGVPMPEELVAVDVTQPEGVAILTGDDFLSKTVASLCRLENRSVPVVQVIDGKLSQKEREQLQSYSRVVILGNESQVSSQAEKLLQGIDVRRIVGNNSCDLTWRFTSEMWQNGTDRVVLSGPGEADLFRAYQQARMYNLPLIVCDSELNESIKSIIKELVSRPTKLTQAIVVGDISNETAKFLTDMKIAVDKVGQ
jgi:putative cell wall-binding protein